MRYWWIDADELTEKFRYWTQVEGSSLESVASDAALGLHASSAGERTTFDIAVLTEGERIAKVFRDLEVEYMPICSAFGTEPEPFTLIGDQHPLYEEPDSIFDDEVPPADGS